LLLLLLCGGRVVLVLVLLLVLDHGGMNGLYGRSWRSTLPSVEDE
jgi:hypothetical protein